MSRDAEQIRREGLEALEERLGRSDALRFLTIVGAPTTGLATSDIQTHIDNQNSIEEKLAALAAEIPASDWNYLPSDLLNDLDHYVYGTPKE